MDVRPHTTTHRCDGRFTTTLPFKTEDDEEGTYRFRSAPNVLNINNLTHDHDELAFEEKQERFVTVTGVLNDPCDQGEFTFEWVKVVDANEIDSTRDDVHIVVPALSLSGSTIPDRVIADRSGNFDYLIAVDCCQDTNGNQTMEIQGGNDDNIEGYTTNPEDSITVACPNGDDVAVEGVLDDPTRSGYVEILFTGDWQCSVYTEIEPSS